jgi:pimeloyl-ACP methyl ester carboxylesterase
MDEISCQAEPVEVRTSQLSTLGLRSRVIQSGPIGDAEAVVFIHGGPGSADDWRDLLPRVGSFARAVAFDLPGFGEADKPADWEYSPIGWATFVGAALRELGIRRAHLVGNDLGGTSALVWAAAHPESLASAVMICSGIPIAYRWHAVGRLHRLPLVGLLAAVAPRGLGFRTVMGRYEPQLPRQVIDRWWSNYDWGTRRALLRFSPIESTLLG